MKMKMPMLHGWNTDNTAKNHNQSINQYRYDSNTSRKTKGRMGTVLTLIFAKFTYMRML